MLGVGQEGGTVLLENESETPFWCPLGQLGLCLALLFSRIEPRTLMYRGQMGFSVQGFYQSGKPRAPLYEGHMGFSVQKRIRNETIWYGVEQDGSWGNVGDLVWN